MTTSFAQAVDAALHREIGVRVKGDLGKILSAIKSAQDSVLEAVNGSHR